MTDVARTRGRILYLVNDASFFVSHRLPLAAEAVSAGYEVHVGLPFATNTVSNQADLDAIREAGATLHDWPMRRGGTAIFGEVGTFISLWRIFATVRPDLAHCVTIKPVLYGGSIARIRGAAAVFAISGLGHVFIAEDRKARLVRGLVAFAYRFALTQRRCTVIFQNEDDRAIFTGRHMVRPKDTVLIPGCGTDIQRFHPSAKPPPEPPIVVLPARLQTDKGVHEFVAAAGILAARGITVRMVLVGYADFDRPGGISESEVNRWCQKDGVEWWGHSTDMPGTLRKAHIVCLPSYREGFSKVLIEAGACGLPVVTTDVPGCRDAVRAGETALLVPARDVTALADALETLIRDPALRERMGRAGRTLVENNYSEERFVAESMALYARQLAGDGHP